MPDGAMTKICEGDVPSGWRETPLASVAEVRVSGVDKLARESEEPVRLCNYIDVYNNDYITGDLQFMQATATTPEIERFGLQVGDVIITKDSETPDDIGISAVVDYAAPDLVCGYHLALLRPNAREVDSTFLAKQLKHHRLASYFGQRANGLTRYGLPNAVVANAPLWLPELPEQRTIGAILRLVDGAIAKTEAVIAKLKQVRAGLLHDLLTRGLDENGRLRDPVAHPEQFQDSPLGRIPREWAMRRLVENASILGGKRLPAGHSYAELPTGYRYLRVIDFYERAISFDELVHLRQDTFAALSRYEISDGELFISIAGSLGYVGVLRVPSKDRIILTENAARIHINSGLVPEFLSLMMQSNGVQQQINAEKGIGSGVPKLALFRIESLWVGRPKEHEQKAVVRLIAEFDDGIRSEQGELAKLQSLKSGLMNDLLTGRVHVPENIMDGGGHT